MTLVRLFLREGRPTNLLRTVTSYTLGVVIVKTVFSLYMAHGTDYLWKRETIVLDTTINLNLYKL